MVVEDLLTYFSRSREATVVRCDGVMQSASRPTALARHECRLLSE